MRARQPEHGEEPGEGRRWRSGRRRCHAASTPPASAPGSARNSHRRQPPAAERGLQQQEDAERSARRQREASTRRSAPVVRSHRAARRGTRAGTRRRRIRCSMSLATASMSRPITSTATSMLRETPSCRITFGLGADAHVRDLAERHLPAVGPVDQQVADVVEAVGGLGHAPHHDLEDLLLLEQAADLDAREHRRRGPPHVAGLDAERLRPGQVDLDLQRRLVASCCTGRRGRRRPRRRLAQTSFALSGASSKSWPKTRTGEVLARARSPACRRCAPSGRSAPSRRARGSP